MTVLIAVQDEGITLQEVYLYMYSYGSVAKTFLLFHGKVEFSHILTTFEIAQV